MKRFTLMLALAFLLASDVALGDLATESSQDETIEHSGGQVFQPAEALAPATPMYPREAWQSGTEGWVTLSFVVRTDGSVRDVVVEDSTGQPQFEQAAMAAARELRYRPAQLDGVPVEQSVPTYKFTFRLEDSEKIFSAGFGHRARAVGRNIERGNLANAKAGLDELRDRPRSNLYEDAWVAYLQALYDSAVGELPAMRQNLLRALAYEERYLPEDLHRNALERLYADYARTGEYLMALETYDRLAALSGAAQVTPAMSEHAARLREIVAGDATLQAQGVIWGKHPWVHKLARGAFEFSDVDGHLESFELRCQRRAQKLDVAEDVSWSVPESWGPCRVYVFGEPGASFALWEYEAG